LRSCNLNLTNINIEAAKFRVCLEFHLGNCKAPCVGLQTSTDYEESIQQIRNILKGNISVVQEHLKTLMKRCAAEMKFEEAQVIKEKLEIISRFQSRSAVVSSTIRNVDVFAMEQDGEFVYINYLKVVNGAVIQAFTLDMKCRVDEEKESLLGFAITEIRQRLSADSNEIIVPFKPDILLDRIRYTVPERGDKYKLLELAHRNAIYYKLEQRKKREELPVKDKTSKNLDRLKADLHMAGRPLHIECFDNSNTMGQNPVAACVVFRNARPSKKEYRHFNIKTVTGADDFSSMEEIIYRRYKRMLDEKNPLPQLIIVDGGKGQLSSAVKSLKKLGISDGVTIIGIAKKLEEIFFPGDSVPLYIDKNSISLKIIQQMRNEAHRFGINFHRDKRSLSMTKSDLDLIKGIGPVTMELLLKKIGSPAKIKKCSPETLSKLVGAKKADILTRYFKK
jgi:excinuclease ABC subunit C